MAAGKTAIRLLACQKLSLLSNLRLQKYLAECGLASRRACERIIADGRVVVDGQLITEQGCKIDPQTQEVLVDGKPVRPNALRYIILNKPKDVVCTSIDPQGRRTCLDLLEGVSERLYTVGRLDRASEGLILLTNDGEWSARLMHPRYHVPKCYKVWTDHRLTRDDVETLRAGVLDDGDFLEAEAVDARREPERAGFRADVELRQGKNRQLRRMFAAVDLRVERLQRCSVGPLTLKGLPLGKWRDLTPEEVEALRSWV